MAATMLSILKLSFVQSEGVEHQDKHAAQPEDDGSFLPYYQCFLHSHQLRFSALSQGFDDLD